MSDDSKDESGSDQDESSTSASIDELLVYLIDSITARFEAPENSVAGTATGFQDLDNLTTGMQTGDLIVVGGRPSMGKSAFAMNIALHGAIKEERPAIIFSMEMSRHQVAERLLSAHGRIALQHIRTGRMTDREWEQASKAIEELGNGNLVIDDSPSLSIDELVKKSNEYAGKFEKQLSLIVVDYVQLMAGNAATTPETRSTQLGEVTRRLKALARQLNCTVIAISQLSRSLESRFDKRPVLSDIRDSGSIEDDADVTMFIYRDDYYTAENSKIPGVAEIIVAKQRNGPLGTVLLAFLKPLLLFENLQ